MKAVGDISSCLSDGSFAIISNGSYQSSSVNFFMLMEWVQTVIINVLFLGGSERLEWHHFLF